MPTQKLVLALLSAYSFAQTPEDKANYPDWSAACDSKGISWEPIKIKTEDGYTLTMFHITATPARPGPATKNPVIFQHGMGGSAMVWTVAITLDPAGKDPMVLQMANEGYDCYIPNNSGI